LLDDAGAIVTLTASAPYVLPPDSYDALLFDLGGVILPLNYGATIARLSELLARDAREIYQETVQSPLFDGFERGEADAVAFRARLRRESHSSAQLSDADIDLAFNAVLGHIPDEHLSLLTRLRETTRTFLLSNTNSIHIEQFRTHYAERHLAKFGPFSELFEQDYYSHELGLRKPDPASFHHILNAHQLEPTRTVFIDDNEHNVSAARALGMQAILHPRNASLAGYFQ
jgi:glucose-1-phosphatase